MATPNTPPPQQTPATDIPSQYVPRDERGEVDGTGLVTVTHGYGHVPPGWRNFIDRTLFVGGIARNVAYAWVQQVRKHAPATILYTFAPDATEEDFLRVTGLSPHLLEPGQQAALLNGMDPHQLVGVMGRESVIALCEKLLKAVGDPSKPGAPAQPTGRPPSDLAALRAAAVNRVSP